jgi:hypothetical protein
MIAKHRQSELVRHRRNNNADTTGASPILFGAERCCESAIIPRRCAQIDRLLLPLFWLFLIFAPLSVSAQTMTYTCAVSTGVCIDTISYNPNGYITVHWHTQVGGVLHLGGADFFQIRYSTPGPAPDIQDKIGSGDEGSYELTVYPTAQIGPYGNYTFKVQGCRGTPASCWGGNQPPWDVEVFTLAAPPPPPQPPQNLHTSISISGDYIQVLWNNPPGVLHATVTRTPAWPSASTLNVPPASGRANLKDILIVSGQRYSYDVCLNYQAGNSCGSVTGELPGPRPINGQITQHPGVAP